MLIKAMIHKCSPFARNPTLTPESFEKRLTNKFNPENGLRDIDNAQDNKRMRAMAKLLIPKSTMLSCIAKAPMTAI